MSDDEMVRMLLRDEVLMPVLFFVGVLGVVLIRSVAGVITSVARERTRREIAAFIAEGAMTPEQGEKLMKAGGKQC